MNKYQATLERANQAENRVFDGDDADRDVEDFTATDQGIDPISTSSYFTRTSLSLSIKDSPGKRLNISA
jgi:hypothetical protein